MESYVEITLLHNCLVNLFCLNLAFACSFNTVQKKHKIACIIIVGLSTFFFHPYSLAIVFLAELMQLLLLYRHQEPTFFLVLGFRLIINLYFFTTIEGSIYNAQFFVAGEQFLGIEWGILLLLNISLTIKGKSELLEHFFIRTCYIEQLKCKGYLDSGNLLFIDNKPVIFLNQLLFETLHMPAIIPCDFQTVSEQQIQWGKNCQFSFDQKNWQPVICLPMQQQTYDCLINMKGLRG